MELTSEARSTMAAGAGAPGTHHGQEPVVRPVDTDAETSTAMLRRCTALAARARVDLLTPGRDEAAGELDVLLAEISRWEPARLAAPDPTMTVLAAAALQDLAERLRGAEPELAATPCGLAAGIQAVLGVLRALMTQGRIDVPA